MPSLAWKLGVGAVVVAIVAYSIVLQQQPLFGVFAASLFYLVAWLTTRASAGGALAGTSRIRVAVAGGLALLALAYSLFVAQQILLGLLVALTVLLVAWATAPGGPVERALQ
ncbi:MAG: hypothetical protein ABEJ23_02235 [Haloarculaceae archaeon]